MNYFMFTNTVGTKGTTKYFSLLVLGLLANNTYLFHESLEILLGMISGLLKNFLRQGRRRPK